MKDTIFVKRNNKIITLKSSKIYNLDSRIAKELIKLNKAEMVVKPKIEIKNIDVW
jgi:hypothetical protein